jgi:hypothetical protein
MLLIGEPLDALEYKDLDNKLSMVLLDHHIGLDLNTLKEAQDNGEIASIKNDSLRIALYKLATIHKFIEEREITANNDNLDFVVPYFYKNTNGRNITSNNNNSYKEKIGYSKLKNHSYSEILNDREFENLLDYRIYYSQEMIRNYDYLQKYLEYIIQLLDKEN